jgi:hypothetical protein
MRIAYLCIGLFCLGSAQAVQAALRPPLPPLPEAGRIYLERFDQPWHMAAEDVDPTVWTQSWSGWSLVREDLPDRAGNVQPGRLYEFDTPEGTKTIREDTGGHIYPDDPSQNRGPHFNDDAGRHYDYKR